MLKIIMIVLIIASVAFDAISDAIIDKTNNRNHLLESLTILCFLLLIFLHKYLDYNELIVIFTYILVRIGLFNITYNATRGLDILYRGKSDQLFDKFMYSMPNGWYVLIMIVCVIIAIFINIRHGI